MFGVQQGECESMKEMERERERERESTMANVLRVSERASANTSEKIFVVSLTLVEVSERQRKKESE